MKKKIFIGFTLILLISTLLTGFLSFTLVTNNYTNSMDIIERQEVNQEVFYYICTSILFSLISALLFGYRFIGKLMEPITEIIDTSQEIANGKFNRRVKIKSNDEIGELATNFNHMADHLENTILQLSDSNTKFKALLTSMTDPIIAIDNNNIIILFNRAAEELFKINSKDALNKNILEFIKEYSLDKQLIEIFTTNNELIEINISQPDEKILKINTNLIHLEYNPIRVIGKVAVIQDVTEIRRLEKMRSDFVENVSHELKTPLTSITGFVETLKNGAVEDKEVTMRFLDIIDIEADRLKRLINDILTLSEIENMETNSIMNEVLPTNTLKEVADFIKPIADSKKVELHTEIENNLPSIFGNRDWFKQLTINLLDNAIKYTPTGGKVQLIAYKKYNNIIIIVKDTGIGISKKHLNRLFERFYRVDKARSRKVGGTGLGLAIVKHVMISFNGKIKVNSEEGKGTEFSVILPIHKET